MEVVDWLYFIVEVLNLALSDWGLQPVDVHPLVVGVHDIHRLLLFLMAMAWMMVKTGFIMIRYC